jgi:hypothetical protein
MAPLSIRQERAGAGPNFTEVWCRPGQHDIPEPPRPLPSSPPVLLSSLVAHFEKHGQRRVESGDGPIRSDGIEACGPPLIALPDGVDAGRAVPRPGQASTERCATPHHLAAWRWARRRVAVVRHRGQGAPLLGFADDRTGHLGIGTARHGAGVDPPGHDHVNRPGLQSPRLRLHAPRFKLTPVLAHPAQACSCPPTALPRPHRARTGKSRHRETRQPSPRHRRLARRRAGLPGLDRTDRHGRPCASRSTRPLRRARPVDRAGPHGVRLRHLGPSRPRGSARHEAPMTRSAHPTRCPVV